MTDLRKIAYTNLLCLALLIGSRPTRYLAITRSSAAAQRDHHTEGNVVQPSSPHMLRPGTGDPSLKMNIESAIREWEQHTGARVSEPARNSLILEYVEASERLRSQDTDWTSSRVNALARPTIDHFLTDEVGKARRPSMLDLILDSSGISKGISTTLYPTDSHYGRIRTGCTPQGADVSVDGERLGESGRLLVVLIGTRTVTMSKANFTSCNTQVTVVAGKISDVTCKLQQAPAARPN